MKKFTKHKYHAKPQNIDGMHFSSKKEAEYYGKLKILKQNGDILFFLRQTPFHLPGNIKYVIDFIEFWENGDIKYVDIKGFMTSTAKLKIKQVEALYPIKIEVK